MALSVRQKASAEHFHKGFMTGNIFEIKRFAVHDGDGIRTTVFFKGCPLRCVWCHNPEGLSAKGQLAYYAHKCIGCMECASVCENGAHPLVSGVHTFEYTLCQGCGKCADVCLGEALTFYGKTITVGDLLPTLLADREFYENSNGGVTLSGGECLLQADFCAELLSALKAEGIHTAVDTCGDVPKEAFDKVIPFTDVFLYDLKAYKEETHIRATGRTNLRILENLRYLQTRGKKVEIRIPYVPQYNAQEMDDLARVLAPMSHIYAVRILPYHAYAKSKYQALHMEDTMPEHIPTDDEMNAVRMRFQEISRLKCL